jgi:DNA-binding transcriptional LysR family regulator
MMDLDDLALFARVVEAGGFSAASRATRIPKSRLSRRVGQLEERLGVRLIQRNARSFAVTPIGETVYDHAQKMLSEADAATAAVSEVLSEPAGIVRISTSVMIGELVLADLIADFLLLYPKVKIVLNLSDRFVDLAAERFDLAIRASSAPLADSTLVARRIWSTQLITVASPGFLAQHGTPATPRDLANAPCISLGTADAALKWNFEDATGGVVEIGCEPRLVVDNLIAAAQAAARGLGFAHVPDYTCHRELAEGRLIEVLADWAPKPGPIHAVYPSRRGQTSATRLLIEFLAARLGDIQRRPVAA